MNDLLDLIHVDDRTATSPVIFHAPHGSTNIPAALRPTLLLTNNEIARELLAMTDHETDQLAGASAAGVGASLIRSDLSRLIVDIEKFPGEEEELFSVGMSALYTRTSWGQLSRTEPFTAWPEYPALTDFYVAYGRAFADLAARALATHGRVIIIDVHSYPVQAQPYEIHSHETRPEIDLGVDDSHTPVALVEAAREAFNFFECGENQSFHGTYVPLDFYGRDTRVSSIMLEIRRDMIETRRDEVQVSITRLASLLAG
jgi:N-formylglutamate amidohydrolase